MLDLQSRVPSEHSMHTKQKTLCTFIYEYMCIYIYMYICQHRLKKGPKQ